jgi:AcrR family transcriptional regulator
VSKTPVSSRHSAALQARPTPVRERLLQSAKKLFAQRGFSQTTTAAIAREAGTSESQLMKHFGSKEELLYAIFADGWERLSFVYAAASVSNAPAESLRVVFELLIRTLHEDRDLRDLLLFEAHRMRSEGDFLVTPGGQQFVEQITHLLGELLAASAARERIAPRAAASALIGMLSGMLRDQVMSERLTGKVSPSEEEIRSMFQLLIRCFGSAG